MSNEEADRLVEEEARLDDQAAGEVPVFSVEIAKILHCHQAMKQEQHAWKFLVCRLLAAGVVTEADLESAPGDGETPGITMINAIRRWGIAEACRVQRFIETGIYSSEKFF